MIDAHGGRSWYARKSTAQSSVSSEASRVSKAQIGEQQLSSLAQRMRVADLIWAGTTWPSDDNPGIPAGYTYLAQLAAHDLVQNTSQLPIARDFPGSMQRDYREMRLVLDTIYGGGPGTTPFPYGVSGPEGHNRCLFRLGHARAAEPAPHHTTAPAVLDKQPARDIPRARCPFLSDKPGAVETPDAFVADPRNDQHLIISQLTALFLELHNVVFTKVSALQGTFQAGMLDMLGVPERSAFVSDHAFRQAQDEVAFLHTRKVMALVWRHVLVEDLLKRLLHKDIYDYYTDKSRRFPADLFDQRGYGQVPLEFSHAVFRVGHVMVRHSYRLNDKLDENPSIKKVLDRSSSKRPDLVPLAHDWLVDWSHFFDLGDGKHVNASRRLAPSIIGFLGTSTFMPLEDGHDGGLLRRDLTRGLDMELRSVADLVKDLRIEDRERSDLLAYANHREHELGQWLIKGGMPAADAALLAKQPPLMFFVLYEAAATQAGERLGILGSTIVADTFFEALQLNRDTIEDDPAVAVLAQHVFAAGVPSTMPGVIAFLKAHGGLAAVVA